MDTDWAAMTARGALFAVLLVAVLAPLAYLAQWAHKRATRRRR